jgi:type II secretory pathway pseudopilin PulG
MSSSTNRFFSRDAQAGFALLEFLVAFTILTTFLAAMLSALTVAIRGDHQAAFLTLGTELAKAKLAAAGVDYPLQVGVVTGTFENGYRWRAQVRTQGVITAAGGRALAGYGLEVTVSDPRGNGRRSITLVGFEIEQGARP